MEFDIVMPGYLFCDLIFRGLPSMPTLGEEINGTSLDIRVGGVFNSVSIMKELGLNVGLIADLGNDIFSDFIRSELTSLGVNSSLIRNHPKPLPALTAVLSFPSDRAFVTYAAGQDPFHFNTTDIFTRFPIKHLHLPGFKEAIMSKELIDSALKRKITISLDCQWHPDIMDSDLAWEILKSVNVFLPNDKEALYLTKTTNVDDALEKINKYAKATVIKLGKLGAIGKDETGIYRVSALDVESIDTTGAGDSFNAGFLFGYLNKYSFIESIACGNVCGGWAVTKLKRKNGVLSPSQINTEMVKLLK